MVDRTLTPGTKPTVSSKKLAVRLLKDVYDDGQDHHPPVYVGRKGDVVFIHSIQTAVVSHDGTGHGFVVHDGELELVAEHAHETCEQPYAPTNVDLQRGANVLWSRQFKGTPWEGKVHLIRPDSMEEYRALALQVWTAVEEHRRSLKAGA